MKERFQGFFNKPGIKGMWPYFFVLALGVALMCMAKYIGGGNEDGKAQEAEFSQLLPAVGVSEEGTASFSGYEMALERKIADTLSAVQGVGSVQVLLTLSYKGEIELAQDITYEATQTTDAGGDGKSLTEKKETKHVLVTEKDGDISPIVIKSIEPKIEGAIIVAEGGGSAEIRASLTKAASALLNLPAHKIEILKMNKQ